MECGSHYIDMIEYELELSYKDQRANDGEVQKCG